jgi:predicted phosphoribosyltransferase
LPQALERYRADPPVVLALPRGRVPVGFEVAEALKGVESLHSARLARCPARSREGRLTHVAAVAQAPRRELVLMPDFVL